MRLIRGLIHPHVFVKVGAVYGVKATLIRLDLEVLRLNLRALSVQFIPKQSEGTNEANIPKLQAK